jgi:hypothetical protein
MNQRKAKQVRRLSKEFVITWLKTMLIEEEQKKVNIDNFKNYLPEDTHFFSNGKLMVSAYTPSWFAKRIKKVLKNKNINNITYSDIM